MRNSPGRAVAKSANARFFAGFAATDGTDFELFHFIVMKRGQDMDMDAMVSIEIELKVLIECLKKKEKALSQIAAITENQGFVLTSGLTHDEIYSFFMQMNTEKQTFIQTVLQCDEVFENVLQKIGPTMDAEPKMYTEQIQTLQDLIRVVMDLDVQIRVLEDTNSQILTEELDNIQAPEKPEAIGAGEYGNKQTIEAYKSQSKHKA